MRLAQHAKPLLRVYCRRVFQRLEGQLQPRRFALAVNRRGRKLAKVQADQESRQRALADKQSEHAAISAETAASVKHIDKNLTLIMSVVVPKGMEK